MLKLNSNQSPITLNDLIKKLNRTCPTNFPDKNLILKEYSVNSSKYSVSARRPKVWNKFLKKEDKKEEQNDLFQSLSKKKSNQNCLKSKMTKTKVIKTCHWIL